MMRRERKPRFGWPRRDGHGTWWIRWQGRTIGGSLRGLLGVMWGGCYEYARHGLHRPGLRTPLRFLRHERVRRKMRRTP